MTNATLTHSTRGVHDVASEKAFSLSQHSIVTLLNPASCNALFMKSAVTPIQGNGSSPTGYAKCLPINKSGLNWSSQ